MSDLSNYRRDLAVLETSGGRPIPQIQHNPPTAVSISQVAPWMMSSNGGSSTPSSGPMGNGPGMGGGGGGGVGGVGGGSLSYYNDSTDNLSLASQLSPSFRAGPGRSVQTPNSNNDSPDLAYFGDERRPSLASVTTASSQGSRSSTNRGGLRKLQGFFGEEFPGKEGAAEAPPGQQQLPPVPGKEHRSHSYSNHHRPHRDRNFSNATDHARESSPSGSRPRTPLPSSDVVPFLYQEADVCSPWGLNPAAFVTKVELLT